MGKLITFLSFLIFVDIIFIITGQNIPTSPSSIILNAVIDPTNIKTSQLFTVLFGIAGIAGLAALSGVSTGIVSRAGVDVIGFAAIAATLVLLIGDFLAIFIFFRNINPILAVTIMSPIVAIFVVTIAEWLRGKD